MSSSIDCSSAFSSAMPTSSAPSASSGSDAIGGGGLGVNAPTLGLGQERDELTEAAAAAEEAARAAGKDPANMTDAEREKEYFKVINAENKKKRGGTSAKRKKVKK